MHILRIHLPVWSYAPVNAIEGRKIELELLANGANVNLCSFRVPAGGGGF